MANPWMICTVTSVLVGLLGMVLGLMSSRFRPVAPWGLGRGFKRRVLAMELARSPGEVELILGPFDHGNRVVMRQIQMVDFAFILAYWTLFVAASWALTYRSFPGSTRLGLIAIACATAGASFDICENFVILEILRVPLDKNSQELINWCRICSQIKWAAVFLFMILIAPLFCVLAREGNGWGYYVMATVLTLVGLAGFVMVWFGEKVEPIISFVPVAVLGLAVSFGYLAVRHVAMV